MGTQQGRSLETEQTQGALRALEIAPAAIPDAANDGVPFPVDPSEEEGLRTARGFAIAVTVGAFLWTVGVLLIRYWH